MNGSENRDKQVIGLYGEMRLAMELHNRGWQVYRTYIDEKRAKTLPNGKRYDYSVFEKFLNNFDCLEEPMDGDSWK